MCGWVMGEENKMNGQNGNKKKEIVNNCPVRNKQRKEMRHTYSSSKHSHHKTVLK